ncbi:MAG: tRNA pseudouridine(38-40) synthase TruA [Thermodesulfobacteriota bacterium]
MTTATPKNFKLVVEYDGTRFSGWQVQANARTVQGEIERAIATMTRQSIRINGSGRTDAGVHALGQVANFRCETALTASAFYSGLNSLLPADIVVRSCQSVPESFHARYDATGKTYHYRIFNRHLPVAIGRQYVWHVRKKLDISAMEAALDHIVGTHNFKAFENSGSPKSRTTRTVYNAIIEQQQDSRYLTVKLTADGFLRYMVRNIVGTIVEVGLAKYPPGRISDILTAGDRSLAGTTAPPHGLFLVSVNYAASASPEASPDLSR